MPRSTLLPAVLVVSACTGQPEVVAIRIEESPPTRRAPPKESAPPALAPAPKQAAPVDPPAHEPVPVVPIASSPTPSPAVLDVSEAPRNVATLDAWITRIRQLPPHEVATAISGLARTHADAWPHVANLLTQPLPGGRHDLTHLRPLVDALPLPDDGYESSLLRLLAIDPAKVSAALQPLLREMIVRNALLATLRQLDQAPADQRAQAIDIAAELGTRERPWFGAMSRASVAALGDAGLFALHDLARSTDMSAGGRRRASFATLMLDRMGKATPASALRALQAQPQRARELVDVLVKNPDPTALAALLTLADDAQPSLRKAVRAGVEEILATKVIPERAAHKLVELATHAQLGQGIEQAQLLSAKQLWQAFVTRLDDAHRVAMTQALDLALAQTGAAPGLLALAPNDVPAERHAGLSAELAKRSEEHVARGNLLVAAQLARQAALFAALPAHATRLRERAYGILQTNEPQVASGEPTPTSRVTWPTSMGISAIGATFLLALLRRRKST